MERQTSRHWLERQWKHWWTLWHPVVLAGTCRVSCLFICLWKIWKTLLKLTLCTRPSLELIQLQGRRECTLWVCFVLFIIDPFPHYDTFWRPWETSLLKTLWKKEKLLVRSNFSFTHIVFYPFRELSDIFIKFWNCRLRTISIWTSIKFVVWLGLSSHINRLGIVSFWPGCIFCLCLCLSTKNCKF